MGASHDDHDAMLGTNNHESQWTRKRSRTAASDCEWESTVHFPRAARPNCESSGDYCWMLKRILLTMTRSIQTGFTCGGWGIQLACTATYTLFWRNLWRKFHSLVGECNSPNLYFWNENGRWIKPVLQTICRTWTTRPTQCGWYCFRKALISPLAREKGAGDGQWNTT